MAIPVSVIGPTSPPIDVVIAMATRLEERGYDAMLWPDHLIGMSDSIWTPDITPLALIQSNPNLFLDTVASIAAVGVATQRLRLGTDVTETYRRHPAMLANEWLSLDHITKGRAILGIGPGEAENIVPYGIEMSRPVARLEEALKIVRLLWENDGPVDFDGEFWTLRGAVCGLGPYEAGRYPPIWVAAQRPRGLGITGRLGDGWVPLFMTPAEYAERSAMIDAAATAAGRDPGAILRSLTHYVTLAEDHEDCHRVIESPLAKWIMLTLPSEFYESRGVEHPLGKGFRGIVDYVPDYYSREDTLKAIAQVSDELAHEFYFHGTPDDVEKQVLPYVEVGLQAIVFMDITVLGDLNLMMPSMELLDALVARLGQI